MRFEGEIESVSALAREAGRAILDVKTVARATATEKDGGQGPVTAADLAADLLIRAGLNARFPDDMVVTEETWQVGTAIEPAERVWFVDPLDGTQDFVAGRADYAVQIGLCVGGVPTLGFLYQPETGVLWRGVVDGDHRLCERVDPDGSVHVLHVDTGPKLPNPPRVAVSVSHPTRLADFVVNELGGTAIPRGSVGIKIGLIVDGGADVYVSGSRYIKVWDTCAPAVVLQAAGGEMTGLLGERLEYTGTAAHADGVRAWTPAARGTLQPRLEAVVARFKR